MNDTADMGGVDSLMIIFMNQKVSGLVSLQRGEILPCRVALFSPLYL